MIKIVQQESSKFIHLPDTEERTEAQTFIYQIHNKALLLVLAAA